MKNLLILILLVLFGVGCGGGQIDVNALVDEINTSGKITDQQAKILSKGGLLTLNGLTSITDEQAKSLSKSKGMLNLDGLTTITDEQAKSFSAVKFLFISDPCAKLIGKYKK